MELGFALFGIGAALAVWGFGEFINRHPRLFGYDNDAA